MYLIKSYGAVFSNKALSDFTTVVQSFPCSCLGCRSQNKYMLLPKKHLKKLIASKQGQTKSKPTFKKTWNSFDKAMLLLSFRVMKQKEIKKSAADSNISNTTSALNISSDTAEDLSTLDMDRGEKVEKAALLNSTDATVVTNNLSPPASSEDLKSLAKFETILNKERKLKEPSSQDSLGSILSTPKGKYELRASTLIPRDYGSKDGEEVDEDMEKDNAEVVIDLTEDEDTIQATGMFT